MNRCKIIRFYCFQKFSINFTTALFISSSKWTKENPFIYHNVMMCFRGNRQRGRINPHGMKRMDLKFPLLPQIFGESLCTCEYESFGKFICMTVCIIRSFLPIGPRKENPFNHENRLCSRQMKVQRTTAGDFYDLTKCRHF